MDVLLLIRAATVFDVVLTEEAPEPAPVIEISPAETDTDAATPVAVIVIALSVVTSMLDPSTVESIIAASVDPVIELFAETIATPKEKTAWLPAATVADAETAFASSEVVSTVSTAQSADGVYITVCDKGARRSTMHVIREGASSRNCARNVYPMPTFTVTATVVHAFICTPEFRLMSTMPSEFTVAPDAQRDGCANALFAEAAEASIPR